MKRASAFLVVVVASVGLTAQASAEVMHYSKCKFVEGKTIDDVQASSRRGPTSRSSKSYSATHGRRSRWMSTPMSRRALSGRRSLSWRHS